MEIIVTAHKPNNFSNLISLVANIKQNKNNFTIKQNYSTSFFFSFIYCNADEDYILYTRKRWFGGTFTFLFTLYVKQYTAVLFFHNHYNMDYKIRQKVHIKVKKKNNQHNIIIQAIKPIYILYLSHNLQAFFFFVRTVINSVLHFWNNNMWRYIM